MFETLPDYGGNRRNLQMLVGISKRAFNPHQSRRLELVQLYVMWEESANNDTVFHPVHYSGVVMIDAASGEVVYLMDYIIELDKAGYASRVAALVGALRETICTQDVWLANAKYMWTPGRLLQ